MNIIDIILWLGLVIVFNYVLKFSRVVAVIAFAIASALTLGIVP